MILGRLAQRDSAVREALRVRSLGPGETFSTSEDMAGSLCLVASGRVHLFRTNLDGRRFAVATLGPGSMFGEESLRGGDCAHICALPLERCTLWTFPARLVLEISATNAMFGYGLMQAMGQRLIETEERLEQMAYGTVSSRLAALLLELGGTEPECAVVATHQQLADILCTWRETVSKTLRDFRKRGLVASSRRRLTLLDLGALRLEAGGSW